MVTGVYKLFINSIKDAIQSQLKVIHSGLDRAALFIQKVRLARLTKIYFLFNNIPLSIKLKYKLDALFWYNLYNTLGL